MRGIESCRGARFGLPLGLGTLACWLLCLSLPVVAAQLRLDSVLGEGASTATENQNFAQATVVKPLTFPADHGPHENFRSEWWYLTVSLEDEEGALFGVQFTVFRQALRSGDAEGGPWSGNQLYLAHLAVTDVDGGRHLEAERLARGHPALAGARGSPFRVWVDGWSLAADDGADPSHHAMPPFALVGRSDRFAVQLRLQATKPLVLQGDRGLSPKGPGQASYYYSVPRLAASGTLRVDGKSHRVKGEGWLDREWSTSVLASGQRGWDWFGLQLGTGEEIMVFQLRREDGSRDPYDQGLWVDARGRTRWLRAEDFDLQPLRYWRDENAVAWPVAWHLTLHFPAGARQYVVEAAVDDQRMDTLITYWEGLVRVLDGRGRPAGRGYMELTGYE